LQPAAEAIAALKDHGLTLATAEASTGGLIGHLLTEVPGSSAVYAGGAAVYHNRLKAQIGVHIEVLKEHGAVSAQAAEALSAAICNWAGTDIGLAETGIAGPTGGTDERPVGLFYIALADGDHVVSEEHQFDSNRSGNKQRCAEAALALLLRYLSEI
jgi:nicotinamide-nucleotide amidase